MMRKIYIPIVLSLWLFSCSSSDDNATTVTPATPTDTSSTGTNERVDISILKDKFYNSNSLTFVVEDEYVIITTKDLPDHKSMYYDKSNALYEDYTESDSQFKKNPNSIKTQNYVFKIPRFPEKASTPQAQEMAGLGVAVNGVVFFNQSAAPGDDILDELWTFDQYEGHPQQQGVYHYHNEPVWLTDSIVGQDGLVGILLDGFPVYGRFENGKEITNDDLDEYHGQFGPTKEFPDGIYHYHLTSELPWINGDGYYGTKGTVTK